MAKENLEGSPEKNPLGLTLMQLNSATEEMLRKRIQTYSHLVTNPINTQKSSKTKKKRVCFWALKLLKPPVWQGNVKCFLVSRLASSSPANGKCDETHLSQTGLDNSMLIVRLLTTLILRLQEFARFQASLAISTKAPVSKVVG